MMQLMDSQVDLEETLSPPLVLSRSILKEISRFRTFNLCRSPVNSKNPVPRPISFYRTRNEAFGYRRYY